VETDRLPTYNFIIVSKVVTEPFPSVGFRTSNKAHPIENPPAIN
jgi:hypothetical protein